MNNYKITNDLGFAVYAQAEDDNLLRAAIIMLGNGRYGAVRLDENGTKPVDVLPVMAHFSPADQAKYCLYTFKTDKIEQYITTHRNEIADVLESITVDDGIDSIAKMMARQLRDREKSEQKSKAN